MADVLASTSAVNASAAATLLLKARASAAP
jgi:hypothetical protein